MTTSVSSAAAWTIGARLLERLTGMVSIAILARALSPDDFGVVAMAGAIVSVVQVFSAFGFDWAVVRHPSPTDEHFCTAWTLRLLSVIAVALLLAILAYPTAIFFRQDELVGIVLTMAANLVIGSLENIWVVEFRRSMQFDREFWLRAAGKAAGFAVAVSVALATGTYWALLLGVTASNVATVVSSYVMHPGRPRLTLSKWQELTSFSLWVMVTSAVELVRVRFGDAYIGRVFGPTPVGHYTMALELASLGSTEFAAPVNRVMFSRYSQVGSDIDTLRENFLRASAVIWAIGIPAAIGVAAIAPQVVAVLLGDQWTDAVLLLRVLAISGVLGVAASGTVYVYWSLGRARLFSVLTLIGLALFVVLTVGLSARHGVLGVAIAQVLTSASVVLINYWVLIGLLQIGLRSVFSLSWRTVVSAVVMGLVCNHLSGIMLADGHYSAALQCGVLVLTGVATYALVLGGLWIVSGRPHGAESLLVELAREKAARNSQLRG